jgi:glycosyltransferase involved in cell wall biosynthesis
VKILVCHNYYQQRGGEDQSFADDVRLLESRGHCVVRYTVHNDSIEGMGRWELARKTVWNRETFGRVRELIRKERPYVLHCRNSFPLLSPALYYAAHAEGVPVVQALGNFRLLCPGALFLRDGRVCEDCLRKRVPWPGVLHGCYRGSRTATAVVAGMVTVHRVRKTWTRMVTRYIALTEFSRRKFIEGGLPAERIAVRANSISPDPMPGEGRGGFAVYAGRLSAEKGVDTLLDAWRRLPDPLPLKIIGDGPLAGRVQEAAHCDPRIQWQGFRPLDELLSVLGEARCLIFPSTCYETFGRTVVEAYAKGTPVIASRLGAMAETVQDGHTGLHFEAGDAADLAAKVGWLLAHPAECVQMRCTARRQYEAQYTPDASYQRLMDIYEEALATRKRL